MPAMPADPLAHAIAEGYTLDLRTVLSDAARSLKGSKRVLVVGALAWLAISAAAGWLTLVVGMGAAPSAALGVLATAPLTVGLVMAGARRAAGWPIALADLGAFHAATAPAAIVLLINLVVVLGGEAALGPVGSIPFTVAYGLFASLALFLVADRGLGALAAIRASVRLVRHRWRTLLLLQLVLGAGLALALLPLGLGLVWAGPFALIANGAVYVRAVGLKGGPAPA
jgi:hypothetical protein